jgi:hypothetical protein
VEYGGAVWEGSKLLRRKVVGEWIEAVSVQFVYPCAQLNLSGRFQ